MKPDPHADYRRQADQHFGSAAKQVHEHRNIALLPGEEPRFAADFTPSPLLRHIKAGLVVTGDRVIVRYPQYMLFVIRVGHAESSIPIKHVCSVTTGRQLSQRRVMYGGIAGVSGLFLLMSSLPMLAMSFLAAIMLLFALVLLAFAALQAWLARGLALIVGHGGGGAIRVEVDKAEYQDMLEADRLIQRLVVEAARPVATEAHRTPQYPVTPPYTPPPAPQPVTPPPPAPAPEPASQQPAAPPSIWRG